MVRNKNLKKNNVTGESSPKQKKSKTSSEVLKVCENELNNILATEEKIKKDIAEKEESIPLSKEAINRFFIKFWNGHTDGWF